MVSEKKKPRATVKANVARLDLDISYLKNAKPNYSWELY